VPLSGAFLVPTQSSKPHKHPRQLKPEVIKRIVELRLGLKGRCAEVVYEYLQREHIKVSLSSVKRTLDRLGLTKKKTAWKKYHLSTPRPEALKTWGFSRNRYYPPDEERTGKNVYLHFAGCSLSLGLRQSF
jgi:hypothetical protein